MIIHDRIRSIALTLDDEHFDEVVAKSGTQSGGEFLDRIHALFPQGVPLYIRSTSGGPKPARVAAIRFREGNLVAHLIPQ